jgi:hypothetical protein
MVSAVCSITSFILFFIASCCFRKKREKREEGGQSNLSFSVINGGDINQSNKGSYAFKINPEDLRQNSRVDEEHKKMMEDLRKEIGDQYLRKIAKRGDHDLDSVSAEKLYGNLKRRVEGEG